MQIRALGQQRKDHQAEIDRAIKQLEHQAKTKADDLKHKLRGLEKQLLADEIAAQTAKVEQTRQRFQSRLDAAAAGGRKKQATVEAKKAQLLDKRKQLMLEYVQLEHGF